MYKLISYFANFFNKFLLTPLTIASYYVQKYIGKHCNNNNYCEHILIPSEVNVIIVSISILCKRLKHSEHFIFTPIKLVRQVLLS